MNLLWRARSIAHGALAVALSGLTIVVVVVAATLHAPDLFMVMLFGALIFGLASMASSGSRLMTAAPLVYLGEVSFAVYMVCIPWQLAFSKAATRLFGASEHLPLGLWLIQLAGVVAIAVLVHHLVERPARIWMRLHDPFRRGRAPATVPLTAAATL